MKDIKKVNKKTCDQKCKNLLEYNEIIEPQINMRSEQILT